MGAWACHGLRQSVSNTSPYKPAHRERDVLPVGLLSPLHSHVMNPFTCVSLTFLLTVSQAVAVAAKGKKSSSSGSKSGSKRKVSVPLIAGIIIAVIVGAHASYYHHTLPF